RFVYSMVRTLVGNILYFNTKNCNLNIDDLKENLKAMDRSLSFGIAPSNGLYFEKVYYPEKFKLFD
ncbi:MAG: tRNA pseudouridine(38-40) synthase TruA, partial [Candidatus Kapaibacteriota bacterium]